MTTQYLRLIGKGQVTLPLKWRELIGVKGGFVKAIISNNKIIIEAAEKQEPEWDLECVSLNALPQNDRGTVQKGRKAYKSGDKEAFMGSDDFFSQS